jgi:hypothetical protein
MKVERNATGVIINADNLRVDDVVNQQVLCPACGKTIFNKWPGGWDGHSGYACDVTPGATPEERKEAYKTRYRHLFR